MASSTPTFLNLDWRQKISRDTLLQRLDTLLTDLDSKGKVNIVSSDSTAKGLATPAESNHAFHMVLQRKVGHTKTFVNRRDKATALKNKYLVRMFLVVKAITQLVDTGAQITNRAAYYSLKSNHFDQRSVDKHLKDLGLSIGVHPHLLGVVPEVQQSFVRVPHGSELVVEEVDNVFSFCRENTTVASTYVGGQYTPIKSMYQSILVQDKGTPIRAVVVTEHRSIREKLDEHRDKPGFQGILLVMTGGFPDTACREFLALLAANDALKEVPFVWIADNDPWALSIYSTLKYGSAKMAYASPSMVCPQLVFGGLDLPRFEQFARKFPDRLLSSRSAQGDLSEEAKTKLLDEAKKRVDKLLKKLEATATSHQGKAAIAMVRGLVKSRVFARAGDNLALEQLGRFEAGGQITSLLRLDELETTGVAFFIAENVSTMRGEAHETPALFGELSQTRAAWLEFRELHSSSEVPDERSAEDDALAGQDEMLLGVDEPSFEDLEMYE